MVTTNTNKIQSLGLPTNVNSIEVQIQSFEKEALDKYHSAVKAMPEVGLSEWFFRLLDRRIIPALSRIGFDESIGWVLFKMTAQAWQLMGPIKDKAVWFDPTLSLL